MSESSPPFAPSAKRQMPPWLRDRVNQQKQIIAWNRLRSRQTGTGWPASVDRPSPPSAPHEWVATEVPCDECAGGWHPAKKCVGIDCPCPGDGLSVGEHVSASPLSASSAPTSAEVGCTGNCWVHAPADEMCDHCRSVYYPESADRPSPLTAQDTPGAGRDE